MLLAYSPESLYSCHSFMYFSKVFAPKFVLHRIRIKLSSLYGRAREPQDFPSGKISVSSMSASSIIWGSYMFSATLTIASRNSTKFMLINLSLSNSSICVIIAKLNWTATYFWPKSSFKTFASVRRSVNSLKDINLGAPTVLLRPDHLR